LHKNIAINCVIHWNYPRFAQFNGIKICFFVTANTAGPAGLHVLPSPWLMIVLPGAEKNMNSWRN
jgi:hypothetical protein